jgi:predicted nucleotidyltransferase
MNKILEIKTGSHLYGTNTPSSDEDFVGLFIGDITNYFGLDNTKEVDMSTVSKLESGKNAPDAIDKKFYELRNFFQLCLDNNPNIIEMLFVNEKNIVFNDKFHALNLLQNNHLFPHQGLKQKFIGYSKGQLHKMHIKLENYDALRGLYNWMVENVVETRNPDPFKLGLIYKSNQLFAELRENKSLNGIVKFNDTHASVGDLNINLTEKLTKVYAKIVDRLSKVTNREELFTKYGFDVKFGMHCIRLVLEGKELMETGKLVFPLKNAALLLDIRNGKYTAEEIKEMANDLTSELDSLQSCLPEKPNRVAIERLLLDIMKENFGVGR